MAKKPENTAGAANASAAANIQKTAEQETAKRVEAAENATAKAKEENRLPETMAVTNPAPATTMESPSGAFIEDEIKQAIPTDHPAVDNNPRKGTSAVQNGGDFNDPRRRHPSDPNFVGQGLDLSVYGNEAKGE
ncbi:MAG TPA: hypothetical protein VGN60_07580 [Devosia sp.]|nr:hypothetical protein [Devosia sp.]